MKWLETHKPALHSLQGPGGHMAVFPTSPLKLCGGHETSMAAVECAQAVWSTLHTSIVPSHMLYVPCLLVPRLILTPAAVSWTFCCDNG